MRLAARIVRFGNSGGADRGRALWPCLLEGFYHAKAGEDDCGRLGSELLDRKPQFELCCRRVAWLSAPGH